MNYDEMEAGPELDHLIEQRVFDKVPCDKWRHEYGGWGMAVIGAGQIWRKGDCEHDNCYPEPYPPKRSTDIAAAWEVVEHAHKRGLHLVLFYDDTIGKWTCKFPFGLLGRRNDTQANTAPLAICIARLKALDQETN